MATTTKTPPKSRYKGDRRATTIVLSEALVRLAQEFLPNTSHRCLSQFTESSLRSYFRKNAARVRQSGAKIPEAVFEK